MYANSKGVDHGKTEGASDDNRYWAWIIGVIVLTLLLWILWVILA